MVAGADCETFGDHKVPIAMEFVVSVYVSVLNITKCPEIKTRIVLLESIYIDQNKYLPVIQVCCQHKVHTLPDYLWL